MHVIVNTPGGNIGRPLTGRLLEAGADVTIISRHPGKVGELVTRGARLVEGSIDEAGTLARAFVGGGTLFWLSPPVIREDFTDWTRGNAGLAVDAMKAEGVQRVVVLSSVGAQHPAGCGPVSVLHDVERIFNGGCANVTVLRPAFFMENFLGHVEPIREHGAVMLPLDGNRPFPMVAAADIAARAAAVLLDGAWHGHRVLGVHGPENLTVIQAVEIIGKALGRSLAYRPLAFEQMREGLLDMGMPEHAADMYLELYRAMNEGRLDPAERRTSETTTSTSIGRWAEQVLRPAIGMEAREG
jgi:uncharacterized protein YbjT (DUF2867 family)